MIVWSYASVSTIRRFHTFGYPSPVSQTSNSQTTDMALERADDSQIYETFRPSGSLKAASAPRPFRARVDGRVRPPVDSGRSHTSGLITERNTQTFPTLIVAPLSIDLPKH